MIGTHLESVTQIRTAFETLHVEGPATALDKLRDAMENNIAECNSQKKVARARFIDTEFNPRTQRVWQIAILDSDMEPIVVAIIDNDSESHQRVTQHIEHNIRLGPVRRLSPAQFALALKECDGLRSTDILVEWSKSNCDERGLKATLLQGGLSPFEVTAIVPQDENFINLLSLSKKYLGQIVHFSSWALEVVFGYLFPQHPLTSYHHEAYTDTTKLCIIASVLIQLRKSPERRIYPGSFLRNLTEYFEGLAPIIETALDNRTLRKKVHESQRLLRAKLPQMTQSKITDCYSVMEEVNQEADEIARTFLGNVEMDVGDTDGEPEDGFEDGFPLL
jgi:hypothetical protein